MRMHPRAEAIHRQIEHRQPSSYLGLAEAVIYMKPESWAWTVQAVFYMGVYQGVRITLHDGEKVHYLPGKTSAYTIAGLQDHPGKMHVDHTGAELQPEKTMPRYS
jgi:hypothetical protein